MKPTDFIDEAIRTISARGHSYDSGQERSAARIADVFNALTDHNLSESDVWALMIVLKLVRNQNKYKFDNIVDLIGYAALLGEHQSQPTAITDIPVRPTAQLALAYGHQLDAYGELVGLRRVAGEPDPEYRGRIMNSRKCTHPNYKTTTDGTHQCTYCGTEIDVLDISAVQCPNCSWDIFDKLDDGRRQCTDCATIFTVDEGMKPRI